MLLGSSCPLIDPWKKKNVNFDRRSIMMMRLHLMRITTLSMNVLVKFVSEIFDVLVWHLKIRQKTDYRHRRWEVQHLNVLTAVKFKKTDLLSFFINSSQLRMLYSFFSMETQPTINVNVRHTYWALLNPVAEALYQLWNILSKFTRHWSDLPHILKLLITMDNMHNTWHWNVIGMQWHWNEERFTDIDGTETEIQLPLKRSSRFQCLFPNPR